MKNNLPQAPYTHILEKITKESKQFKSQVSKYTFQFIKKRLNNNDEILKAISFALSSEQKKIKYDSYPFDLEDDIPFWNSIEKFVNTHKSEINSNKKAATNEEMESILSKIIERYVDEIYTPYSRIHFTALKNLTIFLIKYIIFKPFEFFPFGKNKLNIFDYANIDGNVELISELSKKCTIVLVPTHSSHFDSLMAGAGIFYLNHKYNANMEMPVYAAGLNLYEYKIFKYFISKCGIYTIDRRKKNRIYLDALKTFYKSLIIKGCTSLFYPRGTRSRNGSTETKLKYGLLGVPYQTQKLSYKINGKDTKKIIIVPLTISYESVFEANSLINDYLSITHNVQKKRTKPLKFMKILKLMFLVIKRGSHAKITFGSPMDVLGNEIDRNGNSLNEKGENIDLYDKIINNDQDYEEYEEKKNIHNIDFLKKLETKIINTYKQDNYIYPSHIIATASFNLIKKQYKTLSLNDSQFWNLDHNNLKIDIKDLISELTEVYDSLFSKNQPNDYQKPTFSPKIHDLIKLCKEEINIHKDDITKISFEKLKQGNVLKDQIFEYIKGLGAYEIERPLIPYEPHHLKVENLRLLYYYNNKLH